jgi:hypothetical protein
MPNYFIDNNTQCVVDSQLNAKIADLDLGYQYDDDGEDDDSDGFDGSDRDDGDDSEFSGGMETDDSDVESALMGDGRARKPRASAGSFKGKKDSKKSKVNLKRRNRSEAVRVGGSNMTCYWQAPEVFTLSSTFFYFPCKKHCFFSLFKNLYLFFQNDCSALIGITFRFCWAVSILKSLTSIRWLSCCGRLFQLAK